MRRRIPAVAATLQREGQHVRLRRGSEHRIDGPERYDRKSPSIATLAPALRVRRPGAPAAVFAAGAALCLGFFGWTRPPADAAVAAPSSAVFLGTLSQEQTEPVILGEIAARAATCSPGGRVRLRWSERHGQFLLARDVEYDPATGRLSQRVDGGQSFTFAPVTSVGIARALARGRAGSFAAALSLSRSPGPAAPSADL